MRPWSPELAGRLEAHDLNSAALADNPLRDPSTRPLWIYLPPGYDGGDQRYPAIYVLQGFGNFVTRWDNRSMFQRTVPELIDATFVAGAPPCVVVYVDAWTALGGSQFLDSPATGRYQTYLCDDVVAHVDRTIRTFADVERRAVIGHSSGGFGAIHAALDRPDVFSAFAAHSADCAFELTVLPDLARAERALRDRYERSYDAFFAGLGSRQPMSRPEDFVLSYIWALSACYAGDDTIALPFDPETGTLRDEIWARWISLDPISLVAERRQALAGVRALWIDAARSDETLADVSSELLVAAMREVGRSDAALTLYDGGHGDYHGRLPLSVRYLAERLGYSRLGRRRLNGRRT